MGTKITINDYEWFDVTLKEEYPWDQVSVIHCRVVWSGDKNLGGALMSSRVERAIHHAHIIKKLEDGR